MNNLVIDLTHGGVKIAISLAKNRENVIAYDIYNTLNNIDKQMLEIYNVELIKLDDLADFKGNMNIIYPVHMPLSLDEIKSYNPNLNFTFQTHHEIIKELLNDWGEDILKVEITGVKGKTTSVFMLKEILIDYNPLILSSLGAFLYEDKNEIILKKNISITPANIKETVDLAYKYTNPICTEEENKRKYSSAIFESSLGTSGMGDVGLLLNVVEDYPIAQKRSSASKAKKQIFRCKHVCIKKETLDTYYSDEKHENINTFSLTDKNSNLYIEYCDYSLDETYIKLKYCNVKTIKNNVISGDIELKTFAPGKHHLSNVLGVVLTALTLDIDCDKIIKGLKNFKGIEGRCFKKTVNKSIIIEEINPGINTSSIKECIEMLNDLDKYYIAIGGDYGITCEEIDENKIVELLNTLNKEIFLTGNVGASISEKLSKNYKFFKNYSNIYDLAIKDKKNLLFIYRSDYRKVSKR